MDSIHLLGEELSELMQQSGQQCLTVLCPLHPVNPDRSTDRISLKHLAQQAALLIRECWIAPVADNLQQELETMLDQLDLVHPPKGIGIYLNEHTRHIYRYPFTVAPLVQVANRFPIREQLWSIQIQRPYYVLSISENSIRLEEVRDGEWREIHDLFFPKKIFDDYEYARPVRSSSYAGHAHVKSFERDKKEMEHVRLGAMFQDSNEPLIPYLMNGEPLILAGAERDMSIFRQVSAHTNQVIYQVNGNYQFAHQELFKDKVLHAIHEHQHALMHQSVSSFLEKWGSGLARCGLQDCWQAVEQGQGLQLLVERGYRESMYLSLAGSFSKENIGKSARFIPDAIDELMETTLLKGGSVMFVDNNMLSSAQRVALTLRYT